MSEVLPAKLAALGREVRSAAIPDGCKETAIWCLGKLPALYDKFCQTNESRHGDEITRFVQVMLDELIKNKTICPEVQRVVARITDGLRLLHEQFGLPGLNLKAPSSPRKAG